MEDIEDWLRKNECRPFEDSDGNLCITVKSAYESFGGEQDARLKEAKEYGIDRLVRFYGKVYLSEPLSTSLSAVAQSDNEIKLSQIGTTPTTPTKLYDAASTPDFHISPRECVRMKVLVKIPKDTFEDHTVNNSSCDVNKPTDYLSALISVENYERDIDYVTTSMEDFLPKMAKADKYIENINIVEEIKNLRRTKRVIRRYFNLNSVTAAAIKEEECEADKESQMEIGFSNDYKPVFALIDGNKHTIGYDCFLEAYKLNHSTTANYLIQLGSMSLELRNQLSLDFDIFQFLTQYTYPTPVVKTKNNTLDGLPKYDSNGNLFSFANLAKLITLDLDKKSCKDGETLVEENRVILDGATRRNIAETVRQSKEFVGNMTFSESEGWKDLKETGGSIRDATVDSAITKIYNDVLDKIDFNCVLEESLKCSLEAAITRLGEAAFDDPDLSEFFNADGVIELFTACGPNDCENEQLQLKVGLPIFQGMKIPDNFPTVDYLAKTIDAALKKLYDMLINAIVSFINGIFELMCKAVSLLPDGAAIKSMFGDGFTSWLSKTIGVDVSKLAEGSAWADAVLSAGGEGFMGVVGNFVSKTAGSRDSSGNWVWGGSVTALYSGTGVSLNLPNPSTGLVEQMFVSQEFLYQKMDGFKKATEDLEAVLTPEEYNSLCKGSAPEVVVDVAHECLSIGNPEMFESPEDVTYLFSALGKIVDGNFLENPTTTPFSVSNACQLGDGTEQDQMAKNYLISKDPLLSDSEIEELLSKEKNRLIQKVKKIHTLLKEFQDGSIFPDFPSLFGSDDSLIPETPPVISAALATVSEGLYSSTINSFNVSMTQYAPLWEKTIKFSTSEDEDTNPTFAKLASKIMRKKDEKSLSLNLTVDGSITNLGYKINDGVPEDDIVASVTEASSEMSLGIYEWYKGNFDAGKWTTEKFNYQGDDDEQFEIMLDEAGIRVINLKESPWEFLSKALIVTILAAVLIVGTIGLGAIAVGAALGYSLVYASMGAVMATMVILSGIMYMGLAAYGIWELILYWSAAEEEEITEEYVKCLHSSGKITVSEYDAIVPQIDELVEKTKTAQDMLQWGEIQKIANHLEDLDDENGSHEKIFDITTMLKEPKPGYKTELILKSEVSGQWNPLKKDVFYTKAIVRETPYTSEKVSLERPLGFSEVITSFERRGVRSDASFTTTDSMTPAEMAASATETISLQDIYDSGTSLTEYDRVENKISNYRMENESSLLLGRKIAEPNFLETRYSSTIDAPDKSIMELWESQATSDNKMQEYHLRLLEIFEEIIPTGATAEQFQQILTQYKDDVVEMHEIIWKGCITNMAERVFNNRMYKDEYLNGLELEYPKQDILGYKKVTEASVDLTNSIMKLESSNNDYCDTLTPLRRSGSITGLRLMIRTFIVERVLNSLQVFDTFNKGFMTSDMFKKAVFDDIKVEMNKYYQSFASTLEDKIFSDMKEVASKYFEIQRLLGNEVPEINTGKEAILEIIKMEVDDINTTIDSQLKLDEFYHSSSWDDFVFDILLTRGEYSSPGKSDDESDYVNFGSILAPYFEANTRYVKIDEDTYTYVAEILFLSIDKVISAECDGPPPTTTTDGCPPVGDYSKAKALLFNNEIYQDLVSYVFPLKDAATLLSTYHLSAITDPAVFSATIDGKHVTDLFAETKLSTLQAFLACVHGAGETTYIDPFLEKLKT